MVISQVHFVRKLQVSSEDGKFQLGLGELISGENGGMLVFQ